MKLFLSVILLILAFYQLHMLGADPPPRFIVRARRERGVNGAVAGAFNGRRVRFFVRLEWRVQTTLGV